MTPPTKPSPCPACALRDWMSSVEKAINALAAAPAAEAPAAPKPAALGYNVSAHEVPHRGRIRERAQGWG